nr:diguanylate cyclase [Acidihalobacter ferrooxydans]
MVTCNEKTCGSGSVSTSPQSIRPKPGSLDAGFGVALLSPHTQPDTQDPDHAQNAPPDCERRQSSAIQGHARCPDTTGHAQDRPPGGIAGAGKRTKSADNATYDDLPVAIFQFEHDRIAYANRLGLSLLEAVTPEEILGRSLFDFVHPLDKPRIHNRLERALTGRGAMRPVEMRLRTCADHVRIVSARAQRVGDTSGLIAAVTDITPQRLRSYLQETERNVRHLFENTTDIYYRIDALGKVLMASPAVERILGYTCEAVIGQDSSMFYADPRDRDELVHALTTYGKISDYEVTLLHRDGTHVCVSVSSHAINDEEGNYLAVEGVMRDISERKRLERELHELASHDPLTGLLNRRAFLERATQALQRGQRHAWPITFMILDIDWFKRVNDRFGHLVGDQVLRRFSESVMHQLREIDHFGRLGGEEFGLVLDQCDLNEAHEVGERIRRSIETLECALMEDKPITISVSIGASVSAADDARIETLLERADQALYRAKQEGRNRLVWHKPGYSMSKTNLA